MASASIFNWIGACGAGIQSSFAWSTYNQTAFLGNVSMRQNQAYQKKNYRITWVAMARDDIRSMMSISVNRLNNYIIVSALILGLSSTGVFSVSFDKVNPKFLQEMFFMSMGMSVVFLMVAIMLGVKGQNAAFTHTMKLLIHEIRPENPAEYSHDYMGQAQLIERDGLRGMFRIPGFMPKYGGLFKDARKEAESNFAKTETSYNPENREQAKSKSSFRSPGIEEEEYRPVSDGYENLEGQSAAEQLWYLIKFANFMRLWTPFDLYCKFAMSLGMVALGHGTTYFVLCKIDLGIFFYAVVCMLSPFLYVPMVVVSDNFKFPSRRAAVIGTTCQLAGPIFGLVAVYARARDNSVLQAVCVPMCFLSHSLFYMGVFKVAYNNAGDAKLPALDADEEVLSDMIKEFEEAMQLEISAAEERTGSGKDDQDAEKDEEEGWENDAKYLSMSPRERSTTCSSFAAIGGQTGFPTDSDLFEQQVHALGKNVRRTLRQSLLMAVIMYLILSFWAGRRMFDELRQYYERPIIPIASVVSQWPVAWDGAPLFRPHAISCAGPHLLLADRFHIYALENYASGNNEDLQKVEGCEFAEDILDLSARCEYSAHDVKCIPALLLPGDKGQGCKIQECGKSNASETLPVEGVEHVSSYTKDSSTVTDMMILSQNDELVQYLRKEKGDQWLPQGSLGKVMQSSLQALAASKEILIEFHSHEIKTRHVNSLERHNAHKWHLPAGIGNISSGCVHKTHGKFFSDVATILTYVGSAPDEVEPRLFDIKLPGLLDFRKKHDEASKVARDTANGQGKQTDKHEKKVEEVSKVGRDTAHGQGKQMNKHEKKVGMHHQSSKADEPVHRSRGNICQTLCPKGTCSCYAGPS